MDLAAKIDHTLLRPEATIGRLRRCVDEAVEHGFAAVCVNGCYVPDVVAALAGTPLRTCAVVDFPFGTNPPAVKAAQAAALVADGAQEIDFVAHLPHLLAGDVTAATAEFAQVVEAGRALNPRLVVKVIIESALLLHDDHGAGPSRIEAACCAARQGGCDFVKTSTGFHPAGGASEQAVKLMKQHSGGLLVKASGGIRCYEDAVRLIDAGADRLGCSGSVAVVSASRV